MSFGVFAGIALVVGLILAVGLLSGRRVKDSSDFLSGSGRAGTFLVAGAIMGSLVGSQSTMGTAQLSFQFGFSGWWFTLGCCFGCLALGLVYTHKLRQSGCITELAIVTKEYGPVSSASFLRSSPAPGSFPPCSRERRFGSGRCCPPC